jgi:hypothetical protein
MKSAARLAGLTAVFGGLSLSVLTPALAAAPAVHLTPASNEVAGHTVTVAFSGFKPNETLEVLECNADASIKQDGSGCSLTNAKITHANGSGAGSQALVLGAHNPIGTSALAQCPLSAADYKAGVHCVIAAADPTTRANAATNVYFTPGKVTGMANPLHSGTSTVTLKGAGWETHGLPANCNPATGAPAGSPFVKCTSVVGEVVTIKLNGVTIGTATASPAASGGITFTKSVTLKKGANVFTLSGGTSHETATVTITTSA